MDLEIPLNKNRLFSCMKASDNIGVGKFISWDKDGNFKFGNMGIIDVGHGDFFSTKGYMSIQMPGENVIIKGVGGSADTKVTSSGISMKLDVWKALYYILPIGTDGACKNENFRRVDYSGKLFIPDNWIKLAQIDNNNGTLLVADKYTLKPGDYLDLTKYTSSFVPNTDMVRGLPADFTSNLNINGIQKLPSGLIKQWGNLEATSDSNGNISFTFPTAFPNNCFQVVCVDNSSDCVNYGITSINTTEFGGTVRNSDGSLRESTKTYCRFIATGN